MTKVQSKDIDNKAFLTTGTAPAFEVAIPREAAYADMDRQKITINLHASASAAITINVNWLGAKALVDNTGTAITSATADDYLDLIYDLSQDSFIGSAVGVSSENTSVGTTTSVVLWEDVLAGDGIWAVFYWEQRTITEVGWVEVYHLGDTIDALLNISKTIENEVIISRVFENWFVSVGNPSDLTVTFFGIQNMATTLSLTQAQVSSAFDLALLYEATYGEKIHANSIVRIEIKIDTVSITDYYTVQTDVSSAGSLAIAGSWNISTTTSRVEATDFAVTIPAWFDNKSLYFSWEFRTISWSDCKFRVDINGETVYISDTNIIDDSATHRFWYIYLNVSAWDTIRAYVKNSWGAWMLYFIDTNWHWVGANPQQTITDWLANNKVFKSDSRFKQTNKCDWIITTSGLEWEARDMQINGSLLQTIANVWNDYWLNNIDISTAWSFSILQPAIDTPFLVWKWNTDTTIELMLSQASWAKDRSLGKQELSNITQWFHDTTGTAIRPSTSGNIVEEIKTAGLFYFKMKSQTSSSGQFTVNINWQIFASSWTNGTKTQFFSVRVPAGTLTIAVWTNKGTSSGSSGLVEITPLYNIVLG